MTRPGGDPPERGGGHDPDPDSDPGEGGGREGGAADGDGNARSGAVTANEALRFALELAALAVLGYWGYVRGGTALAGYGLGIGLPLSVAVAWALFGSPAAPYRVGEAGRLVLEVAILGGATLAVLDVWGAVLGGAFGVVAGSNTVLIHLWSE